MAEIARRVPGDRAAGEAIGWFYVYFWVKRANLRAVLEKGAIGILGLFLALLVIELLLEIFWHPVFESTSIVLQVIFAIAFAISLYNKLREWREKRQEYLHIGSASIIAEILSDNRERVIEDGTIQRLLAIFHQTFTPKRSLCVTLALFDGDGQLRIRHRYPEGRTNDTSFAPGEGAAGYSTASRCTVYVPRKRFGHAILHKVETTKGIVTYDYASGVYASRQGDEEYESVLSVPIVIYGTCYGALSFDSTKANAFRRLDLALASFYGSVMAQVLQARQEAEDVRLHRLTPG